MNINQEQNMKEKFTIVENTVMESVITQTVINTQASGKMTRNMAKELISIVKVKPMKVNGKKV